MKFQQNIAAYDNTTDELHKTYLLCEYEDYPAFWVDVVKLNNLTASALLGQKLPRGYSYFLEFEATP